MFIVSKYTTLYWAIINRAKTRTIEGYGEHHHIYPKSCGGSNAKDNIVKLTAKEHFVVHHILTKIMSRYEHEQKMKFAFWRMLNGKHHQFITARLYEYHKCKRRHSNKTKAKMAQNSIGTKNPFYGKQHSQETKIKMRKSALGHTRTKGIPKSKEHIENNRKAQIGLQSGAKNPMFGRKHSPESIEKMKAAKRKPIQI